MPTASEETVVVAARALSHAFGGTYAIRDISLEIFAGEIHAIVGENGAGKSTFGRIVCGHLSPSEGSLTIGDLDLTSASPRRMMDLGVAAVTQEITLVDCLSSASNVFLGLEEANLGHFAQRCLDERFRVMASELGLSHLSPNSVVSQLSPSDQFFVELMRAVARGNRVILLDEPTARLTVTEAELLYAIVSKLAGSGVAIVYISHFLEEVLQLSDRVSVFRDGRLVCTSPAAEQTPRNLIQLMLDSDEFEQYPDKVPLDPDAPAVLEVDRLSSAGLVQDISLTVRQGEIVGITGLVGSGRSSMLHMIFGSKRATSGRIVVGGRVRRIRSARDGVRNGIGLLPENRKAQGLVLYRSVSENMTLASLKAYARLGWVRRTIEDGDVERCCEVMRVKSKATSTPVWTLSGGNQQKVLLARWLMCRPQIFLADEPTRGVDVGSKAAIYRTIADLAASGVGVVVVSSEIEEVIGLAHRIVVMRQGRLVGEFAGEVEKSQLLEAAFGTVDDSKNQVASVHSGISGTQISGS